MDPREKQKSAEVIASKQLDHFAKSAHLPDKLTFELKPAVLFSCAFTLGELI